MRRRLAAVLLLGLGACGTIASIAAEMCWLRVDRRGKSSGWMRGIYVLG